MIITLKSSEVELQLIPYGAAIYQLKTKNKDGVFKNIQLTHSDITKYENGNPYCLGATCGRFIGRIKDAKFEIDGETFNLTKNFLDKHCLHGGIKNFTKVKWEYEVIQNNDKSICVFTHKSSHLEEGFPANVELKIEYILEKNTLTINYFATADRKTYLNISNHGYFNLSDDESTIYNHELKIDSSNYIELDNESIPLDITNVEGRDLDFRNRDTIGNFYQSKDEHIKRFNGIDTPFVLDKSKDYDVHLSHKASGRSVTFKTTYPVVVIYTYNEKGDIEFLDRQNIEHCGVAIELQYAPNAMNREEFHIPIVDVNKPYENSITMIFNDIL